MIIISGLLIRPLIFVLKINLLSLSIDGNMPPMKGGISSGTHHSTGSADEAG